MLRGQATNIGTSAATIPGVSANGLNNTIRNLNFASLELRRVGVQYAREFSARFKRMDFERDINASRRNVRESDALFRADRYMRQNPGRYETATQRINAVRKMREIQSPFGAKRDEYREAYGGDADRILSAEASVAYGKYIQGITDPIGAKRKSLAEQFGGGARGNAMAINAMRAEARENYRYDMLSDYDRHMEDLTERYGGDRNKAENKYKAELSKNLPTFFKNSKMSSKQLYNLNKSFASAKGKAAVITTVASIAGGYLNRIISGADTANKRSVNLENAITLTGGLSKKEIISAQLAGLSSEQMLQGKKHLVERYGTLSNALRVISGAMAGADSDQARIAIAKSLGVDESLVAWADIFAGGGRIDALTEHRKIQARLEEETIRGMMQRRSGSGAWETFKGLSPDSLHARLRDAEWESIAEGFNASARVANQSASLPSQSVGAAASYSGNSNVSVNVGGVVVNTDNAERLGADIISGAMTSPGSRAAIANSLDPMTMK